MPGPIKQARYRLERLALKGAAGLIPRLSRDQLHPFAAGLARLGYACDYRGRTNAIENLDAVFGHEKTSEEIRSMAVDSFRHFVSAQLDAFWSRNLTASNYEKIVSVEFDTPAVEAEIRDSGAIWVTPHYGNFEWISLVMGFRGLRFLLIAQDFKNPLLDEFFTSNREASGHQVTGSSGAMLKLFRTLAVGGHVALLNDLCISPKQAAVPLSQFGFFCSATRIHAELARRTGKPLVPAIAMPREDGGHRMRMFDPIRVAPEDDPSQVAQHCWDLMEPTIAMRPEPWLWMYKHWRYLPPGDPQATRHYPPYANTSRHFDKLFQQAGKIESPPGAKLAHDSD